MTSAEMLSHSQAMNLHVSAAEGDNGLGKRAGSSRFFR